MGETELLGPPLVGAVERALAAPSRSAILEIWSKTLIRLDEDDVDGSLTAARSLIETICKIALKETETEYSDTLEITKLYGLAAKSLGSGLID